MTPNAAILGGFLAGILSGAFAGADLSASAVALGTGRLGPRIAFGLTRRLTVFAALLLLSLALGPFAWAGAAAGYLAGFAFMIARATRA